jgi:metal-responsive CopG/Arc/MetJ family transcriptional regulator
MPQINVDISDDMNKKLETEAERIGARSRQEIIRRILADYFLPKEP